MEVSTGEATRMFRYGACFLPFRLRDHRLFGAQNPIAVPDSSVRKISEISLCPFHSELHCYPTSLCNCFNCSLISRKKYHTMIRCETNNKEAPKMFCSFLFHFLCLRNFHKKLRMCCCNTHLLTNLSDIL